jgi:hypothetical protein
MPAALYPKNKKIEVATRSQRFIDPEQITASLFCGDCEQRFNRNGESEVLTWMACGRRYFWIIVSALSPRPVRRNV